MSLDYPNRADWLAKRNNPVAGSRIYGRMLRVMGATGKNRDPGLFHEHRRLKGPMTPATGPGSIEEADTLRWLVTNGHAKEAADFYEKCHQINYRAGECKMRWDDEWYRRYKAGDVRARGVES